ncbi:MAG: alanine--glyoxylate aminotransferase family protein [archaeon]
MINTKTKQIGVGVLRLYIPGPVSVSEETMRAMNKEMIGHRGKEFQELFGEVSSNLQKVFQTKNRVLVSTSSGSGLMEGAIRNCVNEKVLVCECGAFGKKWADIAKGCGKEVEVLHTEAGKGIKGEDLKKKLSEKKFEAVCLTHNETSTGVMNHLDELAPIIKESGALVLVDTVSSMGGAKVEVDKLGLDVCLTSSQKCFSLPPGLSFASVSEKALEKAKGVKGRGYYFDFVELAKEYDTKQTPYTPAVGLIFGLRAQLERMILEGIENVYERHEDMSRETQKWAKGKGLDLFAEQGYRSTTVTCIENTKKINLDEVKKKVKLRGYVMDAGYRKLNEGLIAAGKNDTFRIPHMGNLTVGELRNYLDCLAEEMKL